MFRNIIKMRKLSVNKCLNNYNKKQLFLSSISVNYSNESQNGNQTHFGFEKVSTEEKFERVNEVFRRVSEKYDLMNDVMSLGIHRYWKQHMMRILSPYPGTQLLDMCGGTGDIAREFIKHIKRNPNDCDSRVVVCDINPDMLAVGQRRAQELGITDPKLIEWILGDAMHLPFDDNSFDAYTVAFGMRNVVNIDQALAEAYRVLRKGGIFVCLEFTRVKNPLLESVYNWYSFQIIPVLGEVFAKDWKSYQYLVESIRQFPDQEDFKAMIESNGFTLVEYSNLMQGIAAIHLGYKK